MNPAHCAAATPTVAELEARLSQVLRREALHARILSLAAQHHPLHDVLREVVQGVEGEYPQLICSILLADAEGKRLLTGAAPSLPAEYNQAIHRTRIGPNIGSCGAAAFSGERVIAADLQTHSGWAAVRALTARHQLASCWSQPIKDSAGKVLGTFAIYQRQTGAPSATEIELIESTGRLLGLLLEYYRALDCLRIKTRQYQMFMQMASDGVVVLDPAGRVVEASDGFLRMVDANREEVLASAIWDWDALNDEDACLKRLANLTESPVIFRTINRTKKGELWNAEVSAAAFQIDERKLIWASARDITERKRLEAELQRRATIDQLTGIANRGHFMETLQSEFSRARRHARSMAVVMMDLDHFKLINDHYGHAIGDEVLRAVARVCLKGLREEDFFGRLGGEEFAIQLPETEADHALEAAERIRRLIAGARIEVSADDPAAVVQPSCSFGVAVLVEDDRSHEALLARADKALYEAKSGGRNRVCFAKG